MRCDSRPTWIILTALILALTPGCAQTDAQDVSRKPQAAPQPGPVAFGEPFPPSVLQNLNRQSGGPASVDLGTVIGKKPTVLFYWIAGNPRADRIFRQLEALVDELGAERLALYGLALQRPGRDGLVIARQLKELGIRTPVLDDPDFKLGRQLQVQSVPFISILDGEGRLRLSNGASLAQTLEYKMTVESAIRRVAEGRGLTSYGYLDRYYPVKELVGRKCPDFKAPLLSNSVEQRWHSMLDSQKLNVLIFWSIDCPHCRNSLPEINQWLKANADGVNVISAASVTNETTKLQTREFCDLNSFVFPTLMDKDLQISQLYQVTTTPTILIIRPDGVIDSVMTSTGGDFATTMEAKKRELL